jgi:hypothetical protein
VGEKFSTIGSPTPTVAPSPMSELTVTTRPRARVGGTTGAVVPDPLVVGVGGALAPVLGASVPAGDEIEPAGAPNSPRPEVEVPRIEMVTVTATAATTTAAANGRAQLRWLRRGAGALIAGTARTSPNADLARARRASRSIRSVPAWLVRSSSPGFVMTFVPRRRASG